MNKIRLSILVVFSFLQCLTAHAQYMSAEQIYKYAKSKDYNALSRLRGYLETQDSKGNTPLCLAVIDDNYDAYNLLRQYGANSQPYCLQSAIAASGSSGTFLGMGAKGWLITGAVVAAGAGVAAAAGGGGGGGGSGSSSSSSSEASKVDCVNGTISGDKCVCNEGWTGSSCATAVTCSYNTTSCTGGYEETGNTCKSGNITYKECKAKTVPSGYTPNACGSGYTTTGTFLSGNTTYYKCTPATCSGFDYTTCPNGYESSGTCLSGTTTKYKCAPAACSGFDYTTCPSGYKSSDTCLSGTTTKHKCAPTACEGYVASCDNGYHATTDTCLSGATTMYKCEADSCTGFEYTACPNGYESAGTCLSGTNTKHKCVPAACTGYVKNCGEGYHKTNDTCLSGYEILYKCALDSSPLIGKKGLSENQNVKLENNEYRDVYGMFIESLSASVANAKIDANYSGESAGITASIDITNNGNDNDVFGIYVAPISASSTSNIYNAYSGENTQSPVKGIIDINNDGDGNVYGMYSTSDKIRLYNAYASLNSGNVEGNISIVNNGDGDVFGMAGNDVANVFNWGRYDYVGKIIVENNGSGKAYGLYGKTFVGNAVAGNAASGHQSKGYITVVNKGEGTAYGMVGNDVRNWDDPTKASTVNMINLGKGLSVGLYSESGVIFNSGLVDIVNVGEGNVVGFYAGSLTDVTNEEVPAPTSARGSITISKEDYRYDGVFYKSSKSDGMAIGIYGEAGASINNNGNIEISGEHTAIGIYAVSGAVVTNNKTIKIIDSHNAIGIYAEAGAKITNKGTIYISGASEAYGIYAEAGATVTNTGNIYINGTHCNGTSCGSENNAIKLNGRKLFQDGLMEVKTVFIPGSGCTIGYTQFNGSCYENISCGINREQYEDKCICQDGYTANDGTSCYADLHCENHNNHEIQVGNSCVCDNGYILVNNVCQPVGLHDGDVNNSNIIIENGEDIDVYGIKGNIKNAQDGTGTIKITNTGNGNVYGMYNSGSGYLYNAGSTSSGTTIGTISITNSGSGNAYGMYGKYTYNNNSGTKQTSLIEMTNTGAGLAVGMYAKDGAIENSGDIKIHNQGDGVAVGVYADGNTTATNSGNITIDRGNMTFKGGKEIGIYGTANSMITNTATGKITLSGAEEAYGIWSEGGNVTNYGTITIDDTSCKGTNCSSVKNAIQLNRGKLFQDGVLEVKTAFVPDSGCAAGYLQFNGSCYRELSCGENREQYEDRCVCKEGYTANDGTACYVDLHCENNHATQVGNTCNCNDGYSKINGVCQRVGLYNISTNNASQVIVNDDDVNVYGMYGNDDMYNALNSSSGTSTGTINITNTGDGDVYGMYNSNDYNMYNAYILSSGTATGTISITNQGSGNVYGMYGDLTLHNAYNYKSSGTAIGTISITNNGIGNAYGMYGASIYNQNSGTNKTSLIEMINTGDGLAVGVYAKDGTINNSGDIKIHNLADGVAVGIYADGTTTATNSGNITIDRGNLTSKGGKAIGIYGAVNATINNSGTITIKSAANAYGIYSEGSSVINTGTIIISGDTDHKNSIILNGGKLLQNGVIYVGSATLAGENGCPVGKIEFYGYCYTNLSCENKHAKQVMNACVCDDGYVMVDGTCQRGKVISQNNTSIDIDNKSSLDVYGMYNKNTNKGGSDYSVIAYNAYNSSSSGTATGTINITNQGNGNVHGMYNSINNSKTNVNVNSSMYNANNDSSSSGTANGTISITNQGNGNVYGMCYDGIYNSDSNAVDFIHNAYNLSSSGMATGTINITNNGYGNAYGIYSGSYNNNSIPDDINNAYNDSSSSGTATGTISITNKGNGNAYGMYSNKGNLHMNNAYNDYLSSGTATGIISIVNQGSGNAYGMYGSNDNGWQINKWISNRSDTDETSIIEMANIGNGLVVGIYGKYHIYGTIRNSGDIKIHNLADGVAIGIYADYATRVYNSGKIIIDRNSYTIDNVKYNATSGKGGKAIGIYGAADATIDNSGTITINDAANAYGIYSEGSNVTNTGTILIDGEYTENAIRLNGGKLAQDSVLIVGADWSNNGEAPNCGKHEHIENGECVCDSGYFMVNGICIRPLSQSDKNNGNITYINTDDSGISGMYHNNSNNMYNAYISSSGTATGTIDITNQSNGNVYGMYNSGSGDLYNAYRDTSSGTATGTISIINNGSGNAYGMYGKNVYNKNYGAYQTSLIEMTNAGDGLAIGMYAKDGTINNSGDIKIHNLADGVAVGVYADGTTTATNSGNITIDRESYGEYNAISEKGGLAIGIYGASGSKITNSGTITVRNADKAYGIWSEGSKVTNTGTILIDGNSEHKNSIVLNGGKLLQDGVMNVSSSIPAGEGGCTEGLIKFGGRCYADLHCDANSTQIMNTCVCASGYIYINGACQQVGLYNISTNNASQVIVNDDDVDVYGMYNNNNKDMYNASGTTTGTISITNNGSGEVYGMYGNGSMYNTSYNTSSGTTTGTISITNNGSGEVYGMYNSGSGNMYNAYNLSSSGTSTGTINITNTGDGDVYGMYNNGSGTMENAYISSSGPAAGIISITNTGNGSTYGMYNSGSGDLYNAYRDMSSGTATGTISIVNIGRGNAYGMYGASIYNQKNKTSLIEMINTGDGLAVGMYAKDGTINNSGYIKIHNLADGVAIGIYADGTTTATNSGNITIDRENYGEYNAISEKGGLAIGIYGASGSKITNSGTITISDANEAYGIYAETGATVKNSGTITIDGIYSHSNKIKLNGSALFQDGVLLVSSNASPQSVNAVTTSDIVVPVDDNATINEPISAASTESTTPAHTPASLNLNDFGGTVVASGTSKFIVEGAISGDLAINNNVIENGFDTAYSVNGMIEAADTSGLNLISQSALFDATLENNTDAVMTMKSFDSVVENNSLADFLQNNYAEENNEKLFRTLKGVETVAQLNDTLDELSGKSMFSRMAFEDLSMLREVSFDMNSKLFKENGAYALSGNVSPANYDNNAGSVGRYSLNGFNDGKRSFGFGVSITDVHTNDRNSDNRRFDRNFMMSAPLGYKTHGFELITAPKAGYSDGTYNRDGFDDMSYEGKVQKRMFALMNEARYPFKFGGLKLTPLAEFNMIGYNVRGHENESEYSLRIKSQNHYSVEAGFGLMAEKEFKMPRNHKFGLNGGVAMYHEFADPYELEVSMNGMNGTFKIRDERRKDNRAVLRSGFDYDFGEDLSLVGSIAAYIDGTNNTNANLDFKYAF